ncbi:MAG: carbon storage regulator [Planctomycetaceae bacterium]
MLVLTRKVGERIVIGDNLEIVLTVVATEGGRVKLGIDADPSIPIQRVNRNDEMLVKFQERLESHHALGTSYAWNGNQSRFAGSH